MLAPQDSCVTTWAYLAQTQVALCRELELELGTNSRWIAATRDSKGMLCSHVPGAYPGDL